MLTGPFVSGCGGDHRNRPPGTPGRGPRGAGSGQAEIPAQPVDVHGEVRVLAAVEQHDRHAVAVLGLQLRVGVDVDLLRDQATLRADPRQRLGRGLAEVAAGAGEQLQPRGRLSHSRSPRRPRRWRRRGGDPESPTRRARAQPLALTPAASAVTSAVRSPVSPSSRSRARLTLPVSECGSDGRKCTDVGTLYLASDSAACAWSSSTVSRSPGARTTTARTAAPVRASRTPMTALSATAGCASSTRSTSAG